MIYSYRKAAIRREALKLKTRAGEMWEQALCVCDQGDVDMTMKLMAEVARLDGLADTITRQITGLGIADKAADV